jgi:murein DD-endopeptidase MepM/ murein hydrolase activator NlpD
VTRSEGTREPAKRHRRPTKGAHLLALASGLLATAATAATAVTAVTAEPRTNERAGAAGNADSAPSTQTSPVDCDGTLAQGGAVVCRADPGSVVELGGATTLADGEGFFVLGFDRDAPATETARIRQPDGTLVERRFEIRPRSYAISRIEGLPPSQVDRFSAEDLARIEASTARKREGDRSRAESSGFRQRFVWPVAGRRTSAFGAQRILNGVEKRPHYGVDLAAPQGTPVRAPADGVVSLADEDLYFEGSMVVLDHGQGFLSKYLHLSRVDVTAGQRVRRGDVIGAVGSRGRSTGAHLCWRLKWRDRHLDPELWLEPDTPASPAAGARGPD